MRTIYKVIIHGRTLESGDLKQLLARAVREKRSMDWRIRHFGRLQDFSHGGYGSLGVDRTLLAAQTG